MSFLSHLYGSLSCDMKTWKKTGFWPCSDAEPCVFTISLINGFSIPCVFSIGFHEYGLAAVQWIAAPTADFSRKACKNWGSGNMSKKMHVKTQGSAPGTLQNLVFYSTFLSVSETPMEVSRYICSLGAVPGSRYQKRYQ